MKEFPERAYFERCTPGIGVFGNPRPLVVKSQQQSADGFQCKPCPITDIVGSFLSCFLLPTVINQKEKGTTYPCFQYLLVGVFFPPDRELYGACGIRD